MGKLLNTRKKAMDFISQRMAQNIKGNFRKTRSMELVQRYMLMEIFIMENGLTIRKKELEGWY